MAQKGPNYVVFFVLNQKITPIMELESILEKRICEIVERAVDKAISRRKTSQEVEPAPNEWLTLTQLLDYDPLKRKRPTFYAYVSKRLIPFKKIGKKLLFRKCEIDEWLMSFKWPTQSEVDQKIDKALLGKV
jgi:hypothetical protein